MVNESYDQPSNSCNILRMETNDIINQDMCEIMPIKTFQFLRGKSYCFRIMLWSVAYSMSDRFIVFS
jgi:hypothetical protein